MSTRSENEPKNDGTRGQEGGTNKWMNVLTNSDCWSEVVIVPNNLGTDCNE